MSDHVLDTTARSLIVDLLNEASRPHVLYELCLVELVRAVKWQEMASFDVIPQFYMQTIY